MKNASDPSCWKRLYGEYVRDGFTQAEMEALWGDNPAQTAAPLWREGLYTELQDGRGRSITAAVCCGAC